MGDVMGAFNQATGLTEDPAKVQKDAQQASLDWQKQMFNQTQANMAPFLQSGTSNLGTLNALMQPGQAFSPTATYGMSQFQASPEYQVMMQQMNNATAGMGAGAAAAGNFGSGNMATALQQNAANIGLQGYTSGLNDWNAQRATGFNMLAGLANPNAAQQMGNFAMQSGVNQGNTMQTGAANQLAARSQQYNQGMNTLGAASNIGKSIYDYLNQGNQGSSNPYSANSFYGSDYGNYGNVSGSDIQGGYSNMEGDLTY